MTPPNQFEKSLNEIFAVKAPALPKRAKKLLVECAPWLALIGGVLSAWAVWSMWHWAHIANMHINYANQINQAYGGGTIASDRLGFGIWLSMIVLAMQALLLIFAFSGLLNHRKSGWNLAYYAILVSIVYGIVVMFSSYGGLSNLFWSLVGAAIGFYFLFQVRSSYVHEITAESTHPSAPPPS